MDITEFIRTYHSNMTEFCACVLEENGNVIVCDKGHLKTLQDIYESRNAGTELPAEATAMFWLIVNLKVVVVDYENQVYSEVLSDEQKTALKALKQAGLISMHLCNIHGKTE